MGDKSWLCVVCGHYIVFAHEAESVPEGGRAHRYCLEAEKVGAADERERIINLINSVALKSLETTVMKPQSKDNLNRQKLAAVCYHLASLIKGEQK